MSSGDNRSISDLLRSLNPYPAGYGYQQEVQYQHQHSAATGSAHSNLSTYQYQDHSIPPAQNLATLLRSQTESYIPGDYIDDSNNSAKTPPESPKRSNAYEFPSVQNPPVSTTPTAVDPRAIIDWGAALRHVTKLSATNEDLIAQVKKLKTNQHQNEQDWWNGRLDIVRKQEERKNSQKDVDDVLRHLGAVSTQGQSEEDNKKELRNYDAKVHRALKTMQRVMEDELSKLGIPFFGTHSRLIKGHAEEGALKDGSITEEDLIIQRSKMVNFLEELCAE